MKFVSFYSCVSTALIPLEARFISKADAHTVTWARIEHFPFPGYSQERVGDPIKSIVNFYSCVRTALVPLETGFLGIADAYGVTCARIEHFRFRLLDNVLPVPAVVECGLSGWIVDSR